MNANVDGLNPASVRARLAALGVRLGCVTVSRDDNEGGTIRVTTIGGGKWYVRNDADVARIATYIR